MNVFAITDDFDAIVLAMRDRRMALGLSQTDVDLLADLPASYTSKLEMSVRNPSASNARSMGKESLPKMLRALGLHVGVFSEPNFRAEKIKKLGHASRDTGEKAIVLQRLPTNQILAERGRLGGRRRREVTSDEERQAAGRVAAAARWPAKPIAKAPRSRAVVAPSPYAAKRAAARQRRQNVIERQTAARQSHQQ